MRRFNKSVCNKVHRIRLALKNIRVCSDFKDAVRDNVTFLEEHGGRGNSATHALGSAAPGEDDDGAPVAATVELSDEQHGDIAAMAVHMYDAGFAPELIAAAVSDKTTKFRHQNRGGRGRTETRGGQVPRMRARTPPRDPKTTSAPTATSQGMWLPTAENLNWNLA